MITAIDFFLRGMIVISAIALITSNFKKIRFNRRDNDRRKVIKYYRNYLVQKGAPISSTMASFITGLSIFRVGSLLHITNNQKYYLGFFEEILVPMEKLDPFIYPMMIISVIAVLLYLGTAIMFNLSILDLGKNHSNSVDIREGNFIVSSGLYKKMRHPIYVAEILMPLLASVALMSWVLLAWCIFVHIPLFIYRIVKEDELMLHYYGDKYREYSQEAGLIFPRFSSKNEK